MVPEEHRLTWLLTLWQLVALGCPAVPESVGDRVPLELPQ